MKHHARERQIVEFYNAIDPARPIAFKARQKANALSADAYVEELHADGFDLPRRSLRNALLRTANADRYLFSGMRGSGKTTELKRLQEELEQTGDWLVLYTDISEYLPLSAPVEIGDFLLVVVSALADEVHSHFGEDFRSSGPLTRFVQFLKSELAIEGLEWSVDTLLGKFGLTAKIKDNPTFQYRLQELTRRSLDRIAAQAHDFTQEVVRFIRHEKYNDQLRVLLIVDSVERLQGVGEAARRVFDSVETLFSTHRDKLRFSVLDVIYSVPPHISAVATAGTGRVYSLPMIRVFDKPEPGRHGAPCAAGIARMLKVVDKRNGTWRTLIREEHMRELACISGGDVRELFSLVRETLNLLDPDNDQHFPAPDAAIEQCKQLRRNQFGTIPADHMDWLKRVALTHDHGLLSQQELGTLSQLLDGKLILQYRNGENWYDAHPLLWEQIDRHVASGK